MRNTACAGANSNEDSWYRGRAGKYMLCYITIYTRWRGEAQGRETVGSATLKTIAREEREREREREGDRTAAQRREQ